VLVRTHDGRSNHRIGIVGIGCQRRQYLRPYAALRPPAAARMDDPELPQSSWEVSPGYPCPIAVEHSCDKHSVLCGGTANMPFAAREHVFEAIPLMVA
jgi:hypothetical protein